MVGLLSGTGRNCTAISVPSEGLNRNHLAVVWVGFPCISIFSMVCMNYLAIFDPPSIHCHSLVTPWASVATEDFASSPWTLKEIFQEWHVMACEARSASNGHLTITNQLTVLLALTIKNRVPLLTPNHSLWMGLIDAYWIWWFIMIYEVPGRVPMGLLSHWAPAVAGSSLSQLYDVPPPGEPSEDQDPTFGHRWEGW